MTSSIDTRLSDSVNGSHHLTRRGVLRETNVGDFDGGSLPPDLLSPSLNNYRPWYDKEVTHIHNELGPFIPKVGWTRWTTETQKIR